MSYRFLFICCSWKETAAPQSVLYSKVKPYTRSDVGLHLVHLGLRLDRFDHGEDREAAFVKKVGANVEQVGQVAHAPSERSVGVGRVARLAKVRARAAARDGGAGREEPKVVDD